MEAKFLDKIRKNYVIQFFGENGITSTSAQFLSNIGQDIIAYDKAMLDSICLVQDIRKFSNGNELLLQDFNNVELFNYDKIVEMTDKIAKINAFTAWMIEAIKTKEAILNFIDLYSVNNFVNDFCTEEEKNAFSAQMPENIHKGFLFAEKDVFNEMSIKDYADYLIIEAMAATKGKIVHKNGSIKETVKSVINALANPNIVSDNGNETTVTTKKVIEGVNKNSLNKMMVALQNDYREAEAQLNSMKYGVQQRIKDVKAECSNEWITLTKRYEEITRNVQTCFDSFKREIKNEVGSWKIVIPNALKETYEMLKNYSKENNE